jgi:glyoxylase-like metal-dependent hydrolase (beta-lactamase superfamily II)
VALWPEQPEDWTEPGAHPVADGVHRIPVPLPFDGLRAVNVYLLAGPDGLILVDAGWATPQTARVIESSLRGLGYGLGDVTQIVVTHAHWDHYTQACAWQAELGVQIWLGRGERHTVEGFRYEAGPFPQQVAMLRRCGAAGLADEVAGVEFGEHERDVPFGPPDGWLDDGDRIALRAGKLEVVATPGHTRGHVVLRDDAAGLLFAGDHVLPHITPSIGFEHSPEPFPLLSYLESLRLVRDQPDALLLPAHGPVTRSVHTRIDELIAHHEQRLAAVSSLVRAGAVTAFAVAAALPWTSRARRLGELGLEHQMLAVLEIEAHLDLLVRRGELDRAENGGRREYAPAR